MFDQHNRFRDDIVDGFYRDALRRRFAKIETPAYLKAAVLEQARQEADRGKPPNFVQRLFRIGSARKAYKPVAPAKRTTEPRS